MSQTYYQSTAAGSIMLFGEHSVLFGGQALICAIDQRIEVNLIPRCDNQINIISDRLGKFETNLSQLESHTSFKFILESIRYFHSYLVTGFNLIINSEFASNLGLGSSAAVTVATLSALSQWLKLNLSPCELFQAARKVIQNVQGAGSGADAAASIFGGVIAFRAQPFEIRQVDKIPSISLIYSGYKTPTKDVISKVAKDFDQLPQLLSHLYSTMDSCSQHALVAWQQEDWPTVGKLMNIYHGLQQALGVSNLSINEIIEKLRQFPTICGSKISGSGLGDCIWGLGDIPKNSFPQNIAQQRAGIQQIDIAINPAGCETKIRQNISLIETNNSLLSK